MDALIGHTGFVGSHLAGQHDFGAAFNSSTLDQAHGRSFRIVVCAAAPGSMFEANRDPDLDAQRVGALRKRLADLRAERFVLVSTIAVLEEPAGQEDESATRFETTLAYGRHRRALEQFCEATFPDCLVIRLPALFGRGLRKNFVFDLLNPMPSLLPPARLGELRERLPADLGASLDRLYALDPGTQLARIDRAALESSGLRDRLDAAVRATDLGAVQFTCPDSTFQFYDMADLWQDIGRGLDRGLRILHLPTEPLRADRVHEAVTGRPMPATGARLHHEDMRTRHADLWGRTDGYIASAEATIVKLRRFARSEGAAC